METQIPTPKQNDILTKDALEFLSELHSRFAERRENLLQARTDRAARIARREEIPDFLKSTLAIRTSNWQVAPAPTDLNCRHVEITGPVEPKMMINALNSGADVFMADLEDSLSPTWENIIVGQQSLQAAVRKTLSFTPDDGRKYQLKEKLATLVVRPRGWHLEEKNLYFNSRPMSASLVDFGLYFFHNAKELLRRGSGPYFYLPKLESHLEARLWNDIFRFSQERLGIPQGSIRATVLIETILAAFEMDEILFELRDHASGLNAGRWDYIFSMIKKFASWNDLIFPDRAQLTMTIPYMRAYTQQLVAVCHRRGAHAIGGMAAFIPSRKDPQINEIALGKVREDKLRESADGFDGTWVAHPDLVPVAAEIFTKKLGSKPHQKDVVAAQGLAIRAEDLLPSPLKDGKVTDAGIENNISVALQYITAWLQGQGAVAIYNLMEDAATAEISRAELWQWVRNDILPRHDFTKRLESERTKLSTHRWPRLDEAAALLSDLVLAREFPEFLTTKAYARLQREGQQ